MLHTLQEFDPQEFSFTLSESSQEMDRGLVLGFMSSSHMPYILNRLQISLKADDEGTCTALHCVCTNSIAPFTLNTSIWIGIRIYLLCLPANGLILCLHWERYQHGTRVQCQHGTPGTVPARYPGCGASTVINGDSTRLHCRFVCACACACQIKILITYNP